MEKIVQQGLLYDFYGQLLTEHQRQVYEAVVYENMSLGEIADEQNVSRQAIHDIIKRTDKILMDYENKLGLVSRFEIIKSKIGSMDTILSELETGSDEIANEKEAIENVRSLCRELVDLV